MGWDHVEPCSCTVPNGDCIWEVDIHHPAMVDTEDAFLFSKFVWEITLRMLSDLSPCA